jgi:type I restriction enzyme M protein
MPKDEFFNTGIYTYLWVFNKNKPLERKDRVILINGSEKFAPLTKSKGKKRVEMMPENREQIVKALSEFKDCEYAKVFDKWHFYHNRQYIILTNLDEDGNTLESILPIRINKDGEEVRDGSIKLKPTKVVQVTEDETTEISEFEITAFDKTKHKSLKDYHDAELKPKLATLDYKEENLKVFSEDAVYWFDEDRETIKAQEKAGERALGCGKIVIKSTYKKPTKTKKASIVITVEFTPDYQKDFEIIPFSPVAEQNEKLIADFLQRYIYKPFVYSDNVVGVELNFNKIFFKPKKLEGSKEILELISKTNTSLNNLEQKLI